MLKEDITYEDYNGNTQTETVRFQLSKSDLIDMEMNTEGGMEQALKEIIRSNDNGLIYNKFKWMMSRAYGEKSEDGRYFRKSAERWESFTETPIYDAIMVRLFQDAAYAAKFFASMMPTEMIDKLPELGSFVDATSSEPAQTEISIDEKPWAHRDPTQVELLEMSREDLIAVMRRKNTSRIIQGD